MTFQSKFNPSIWSCYSSLADFQDSENTTSSLESLNKRLKSSCPNGKISFRKAVEILCTFKCDYMEQYHFAVTNNQMNRQRPETIRRKNALVDIMAAFQNSDMYNPVTLCEFATRFGTYDSTNLPQQPNLTLL